jgi:hypothetical protein
MNSSDEVRIHAGRRVFPQIPYVYYGAMHPMMVGRIVVQ